MRTHFHCQSAFASLAVALVAACSASGLQTSALGTSSVNVQPPSIRASPGDEVQFTATVTGSIDTGVDWSVQEGVAGGSIDGAGKYQAPSSDGTYTVVATSRANRSQRGSALVAVQSNPTPSTSSPCATAPLRTTGTVYYYCDCQAGADPACVAGSDANSSYNCSAAHPCQSYQAAMSRFGSMNAGDTVAFCRGGVWTSFANASSLRNSACPRDSFTDSGYCDVRDYVPSWGSQSTARPRFNTGNYGGLSADGGTQYGGYRIWNLDIEMGNRTNSGPAGISVFDASNIDICNTKVAGGATGMVIQRIADYPRNITIRNSEIRDNGTQGVIGGAFNWTIDSNVLVNNGDQLLEANPGQAHTMYLYGGSSGAPTTGLRVTNNYIHTDPDGVNGYGQCRGVMLIVREYQDDVVVENNNISGSGPFGCGGLYFSESAATAGFHHAHVRRNRITWGDGTTMIMGIGQCQNCEITDNIIESNAPARPAGGGWGPNQGLVVPHDTAPLTTTGAIVRNNTVRLINGGVGITVGASGDSGTDFIVENNVVWTRSGTDNGCFSILEPLASGHPFTSLTYPNTGSNAAGNYCINSGSSPSLFWVDATNHNYTPQAGGPLSGTGIAWGPTSADLLAHPTFAQRAIDASTWSAGDAGAAWSAPFSIGAVISH
jgi:hypothetical protein